MNKIEKGLSEKIKKEPAGHYAVLVTVNDKKPAVDLVKAGLSKIMDGIYSGKLSGKKILELNDHAFVTSIEKDEEMNAL